MSSETKKCDCCKKDIEGLLFVGDSEICDACLNSLIKTTQVNGIDKLNKKDQKILFNFARDYVVKNLLESKYIKMLKLYKAIFCWIVVVATLYYISTYLSLNQLISYLGIGVLFSTLSFIYADKGNKKRIQSYSMIGRGFTFVILSFTYLPFMVVALLKVLLNWLYCGKV